MSTPVDGIRAVTPTPSLLTTARRVPFGYDVWGDGIEFRDTALLVGGHWPKWPGSNHDDKLAAVDATLAKFYPFMVYLPVACDEATAAREEELAAEAEANADASVAWQVARELWTGETVNDGGPDNPSLQLPFPGGVFEPSHILSGVSNPVRALGELIQAHQDATRKGGVTVHVPAVLVAYLLHAGVVRQQGDVYVGPSGSVIVGGPGYPVEGATGPRTQAAPDGAVAGSDEAWMFATGPVEYGIGDTNLNPDDPAARFYDRRTNLWSVYVERQAIYRFDPSAVFAQLVDVPTLPGDA